MMMTINVSIIDLPICEQVWSFHYGQDQALFIWRPVPPSDDFVALGMLATKTEDPPPLDALRCVVSHSTILPGFLLCYL